MSYGNELLADYAFEIEYPFAQHIVNCMKIVGKDDSWYYVFKAELERRIRKN